MDKKEALEIATKIYETCAGRDNCYDCIFEDKFGSKLNGKCLITAMLDSACFNDDTKYGMVKEALKMINPCLCDKQIKNEEQSDNVNHPKHYCKNGLECIQVIKAQLTPEQYKGYLYGNVIKYMWRWQDKNGVEDVKKAAKYLDWLKEELEKE